jgi:hypothetical protein
MLFRVRADRLCFSPSAHREHHLPLAHVRINDEVIAVKHLAFQDL